MQWPVIIMVLVILLTRTGKGTMYIGAEEFYENGFGGRPILLESLVSLNCVGGLVLLVWNSWHWHPTCSFEIIFGGQYFVPTSLSSVVMFSYVLWCDLQPLSSLYCNENISLKAMESS